MPFACARVAEEVSSSGEDKFQVVVTEYVDIKLNNRTAPYVRRRVNILRLPACSAWLSTVPVCLELDLIPFAQGDSIFGFSLMYTSLDDVLPQIHELLSVAHQDLTKEGRSAAQQKLASIIKVSSLFTCLHS